MILLLFVLKENSAMFKCLLSLCFSVATLSLLLTLTSAGIPTTNRLEQIVIGRCLDYQATVHPQLFVNQVHNCTVLWAKFSSAFSYKDPCNVSFSDYNDFISATLLPAYISGVMLWSGVDVNFAKTFGIITQTEMVLAETFPGFMLNDLHWCGKKDFPGINYEVCPDRNDCNDLDDTEMAFWSSLSARYAKLGAGKVRVLLNGSIEHTYRNNSIFRMHEIPNIDSSKVSSLEVVLIHDLDKPKRADCKSDNIHALRQDIEKKGITFICVDNSPDVSYFMCSANSRHQKCRCLLSSSASFIRSNQQLINIWTQLLLACLVTVTCSLKHVYK